MADTHHKSLTRHECKGEIAGNKVSVLVVGEEAQDLENADGVGSDIVMERIRDKFTELKDELEVDDE